jgi:hypothetical protein
MALSVSRDPETGWARVELGMPGGWNGPAEGEKGTGLGICQLILGKLGGYLKVGDSPDRGVILGMAIPLNPRKPIGGGPGGGAVFMPGADPV